MIRPDVKHVIPAGVECWMPPGQGVTLLNVLFGR